MKNQTISNELMELLKSDKNSPLHKFKNSVPTDNLSYLNHWFTFFDYTNNEKDIVADVMGSYGINVKEYEAHYKLLNELTAYIEDCHREILSKIEFEPRLDQYVKLFKREEQNNIKLLVLANLYLNVHKQDKYLNLVDIGNKFNIDRDFIFSLNESHKLFQDKIIESDKSSLHSNDPWTLKEIYFNPSIYSIFAGIKVNPEELVILKGSSIIEFFDLGDPSQLSTFISENEQIEEDEDDISFEDFQDGDFEELFKDEEDEQEVNDELQNNKIDDKDDESYKDDLDYLYYEYAYFRSLLKLKEKQNEDLMYGDKEDERKMRLLEQEIQRQRYLCDLKLEKSKKSGFIPRLEKLAKRIKLNDFEKNVLKALVTTRVFIDPSKSFSSYDSATVKEIIFLLIEDQIQQILAKKYFQKNAKLIKSGFIHIDQRDSLNSSIYESNLVIDSRLLEYLTGEEFNITDHVEGSFFYKSSINIENVKIPKELKERVLTTISNFPTFLKAKKELGFSEIVEYGNSLVMLFVGKSGTGKTMLANAISNYLDKKVLLFNLNSLSQMSSFGDERQLFSVLFREARMNNAILFFDESEEILQDRFNDLLIEIEKHEGIVIFATNATFLIDEAMRRRINLIVNLPSPGPLQRKEIWKIHLPKKITLAKDVDLNQIASRYEINGGLIKNAVFSALAQAVNKSKKSKLILKMKDLEYGAKEQLHNKLFMSNLEKLKVPITGLDRIVLPKKTEGLIKEIVNIEKSWKFLDAEWGFREVFPNHKGISILFHGPSGTGKTITAEALAYETGKKLKIVNYSQIMSMYVGGTEKALEALFEEVADNDSILLFDEADALFTRRTGVTGSNDRYANVETDVLLGMIERYSAFTILTTNYISNIDDAFFRRMSYIIEFKKPDKNERLKLWNMLIPRKMPLHKDVDLSILADKYDFSGGDIRNAIIRVGTHNAIKMQKEIKNSQGDFIRICDEIKENKNNGMASIGFK